MAIKGNENAREEKEEADPRFLEELVIVFGEYKMCFFPSWLQLLGTAKIFNDLTIRQKNSDQ